MREFCDMLECNLRLVALKQDAKTQHGRPEVGSKFQNPAGSLRPSKRKPRTILSFDRRTLRANTPFSEWQSRFKLGLHRFASERLSEQKAAREGSCRPSPAFQTCTTSRLAPALLRLNLRRFTVPKDPAGPAIVNRLAFKGFLPRIPRQWTASTIGGVSRRRVRADCMLPLKGSRRLRKMLSGLSSR